MKPVIVQTCDIWKMGDSCRIVGVYTSRIKLEKQLRKMLKEKDIELNEGSPIDLPLSNFTIQDMHNFIDYISLTEVEFNEEQ